MRVRLLQILYGVAVFVVGSGCQTDTANYNGSLPELTTAARRVMEVENRWSIKVSNDSEADFQKWRATLRNVYNPTAEWDSLYAILASELQRKRSVEEKDAAIEKLLIAVGATEGLVDICSRASIRTHGSKYLRNEESVRKQVANVVLAQRLTTSTYYRFLNRHELRNAVE